MSIRFEDVSFAYFEDGKNTIEHFSAEFSAEKITVLSGVSGCGKSTLLYLAAGLYPHNGGVLRGGSIRIDGQSIDSLPVNQRCKLVGMMFQNPELQFCMDTVRNELIFCLENLCTPAEQVEQKITQALEFCEISHLQNRSLHSLSGGEKQKVMLACLVLIHPKWLLLDEPFANIDTTSALQIAKKLKVLHQEQGIGILAVDHRLDYWITIADTLAVFQGGALLPDPLDLHRPDYKKIEQAGIIAPDLPYPADLPAASPGNVVLALDHVSVRYGEQTILNNVSADFRKGMIYAIVGESGCGKSTLFHALAGICRYSGTVLLDGEKLNYRKKKQIGKIGFVTQNPQDQFIGGTVRQEVSAGLKQNVAEVSESVLRSIHLWRYRDISPYLLSQGQQRRLGVATLMAYDCQVLVCDEPTYAQDRKNTITIMNDLCQQARKHQVALIFSTHDLQLAQDYADVVLQLKGGVLHETT